MRIQKEKIPIAHEVQETNAVLKEVDRYIDQDLLSSCLITYREGAKGLCLKVTVIDDNTTYKIVKIYILAEFQSVYISAEEYIRTRFEKDKKIEQTSNVIFSQEYYAHDAWANNPQKCQDIDKANILNKREAAKQVALLVRMAKSSNAEKFINNK